MLYPKILSAVSILSLVASQDITIYTKNVYNSHQQDIGILAYDAEHRTADFRLSPDVSIETTAFSLCARDLAGTDCFGYQEIDQTGPGALGGDFGLVIDDEGTIQRLSFSRGDVPQEFSCHVGTVNMALKPNLNPFNKRNANDQQAQTQTKKVVRTRVVENEEGEEVEVEEEVEEEVAVDTRSWVQKNWMYIVPPLVLVLILSPSDSPEGAK
ncbi:hypothetical protein JCM33374_g4170 [Metschnikowia sp. JCM 33374]|nr:hypothetical protein JCM33374_g4170 [Metschnikowia sp. JCM 33374]